MKAIRLFSMAAVALMMGACSSENDIEQAQQLAPETGKIHFEATIAAPNADARTRTTYTESGTSINVAWKSGDQIALIHGGNLDVVTVGTPNSDGSAPISGSIHAPSSTEEDVLLIYPAASVESATPKSPWPYTPNTTYLAKGFAQDGTLEYIQNNLDARQGSGKIISDGGSGGTLKENVKMESKIAIWKLSLQDNAATPNALSATTVTVRVGNTTVAAGTAAAKSSYYLCLVPTTMGSGDLTITAVVGANGYIYKKTGGVTLGNGKYYQSTVTMASHFTMAAAATSSDLGKLICTDGHIHASAAPGDGCSATRVAMIAYVGNDAETSTTYNHGLALALADASTNATWCNQYTVSCPTTQKDSEANAKTDMAGIANTDALVSPGHTHTAASLARGNNSGVHPTGTSAWFLPSAGQWNKMLGAGCLGYTDLHLADNGYWSSTEYNAAYAWRFVFNNGGSCYLTNDVGSTYTDNKKSFPNPVRACLAF